LPTQNLVLRALIAADPRLRAEITPHVMRKGDVLIEAGQTIDRVYFPTSGLVSSTIPFESGEEVECMLSGRNGAIGALAAIGLEVAAVRSLCLTDGHSWSMPLPRLRAAVEAQPAIATVLDYVCRAQVHSGLRIGACNAVHGTAARLARWLLLANDLTDGAPIAVGQEDLGRLLGVQRSLINPLLGSLQAAQVISVGRARITVLDRAGLSAKVCSCHASLDVASRVMVNIPT
jgi:CRP-like cAMP-binding protein